MERIRIEHLYEDLEEIEKEMDESNLLGKKKRDRLRVLEAFAHHLKVFWSMLIVYLKITQRNFSLRRKKFLSFLD